MEFFICNNELSFSKTLTPFCQNREELKANEFDTNNRCIHTQLIKHKVNFAIKNVKSGYGIVSVYKV